MPLLSLAHHNWRRRRAPRGPLAASWRTGPSLVQRRRPGRAFDTAGKGAHLAAHGFPDPQGLKSLRARPPDARTDGPRGIYDADLFAVAPEGLDALANDDAPFAPALLTLSRWTDGIRPRRTIRISSGLPVASTLVVPGETIALTDLKGWLREWSRDLRREQRGLLLTSAHRAKGLEFDHVVILDGGWRRH